MPLTFFVTHKCIIASATVLNFNPAECRLACKLTLDVLMFYSMAGEKKISLCITIKITFGKTEDKGKGVDQDTR